MNHLKIELINNYNRLISKELMKVQPSNTLRVQESEPRKDLRKISPRRNGRPVKPAINQAI